MNKLEPGSDVHIFPQDIKNHRAKVKRSLQYNDEDKETLRTLLRLLEANNYIVKTKTYEENELTHIFFASADLLDQALK